MSIELYSLFYSKNPCLSAFWRMMKLWKENNFIGGNSARDSGMIEIAMDIPENADSKYLEYINGKSDEIKEYFNA